MTRPNYATTHAIERYIQRHRQGWTFENARVELLREAATAVLQERVAGEEPIWRCASGRLLVVSCDGAIRTVLPMDAMRPNRRPRK